MAVNPKSLNNLKPAKKGEVRNRKGKQKGTLNAKTIITRWLESNQTVKKDPITGIEKEVTYTQFDLMVMGLMNKARRGDAGAFNALLDRVEGKVPQKHEIEADVNNFTVGYGKEQPV